MEVFTEVRRVLLPDGTLWLNISDTYAGKGNEGDFIDPKNPNGRNLPKFIDFSAIFLHFYPAFFC